MAWRCREFFFCNIFGLFNFRSTIFFEFDLLGHFSILRHRTLCPEDCPDPPGPPHTTLPGTLLGGQQGGCAPDNDMRKRKRRRKVSSHTPNRSADFFFNIDPLVPKTFPWHVARLDWTVPDQSAYPHSRGEASMPSQSFS